MRAVKHWLADDQREMPKGDALRNNEELLERREDEPITLKFAGCLILCVSFGFWGMHQLSRLRRSSREK